MTTDAGLRAIWEKLEELWSMRPLPSGRCRYCEACQTNIHGAPRSLCLDCNDHRLALKERFNRFPAPATVESDDALEAIRQSRVDEAPRVKVEPPAEWLPYRDSDE